MPDDLLQVSEKSSEKMLITAFSSYTGLIVRWLALAFCDQSRILAVIFLCFFSGFLVFILKCFKVSGRGGKLIGIPVLLLMGP